MTVLPIYNYLLVPDTTIYIQAEYFKRLIGRAPVPDEAVVLIVLRENIRKSEFAPERFYPIGIMTKVTEINNNGYIMLHTSYRMAFKVITVFKDKTLDVEAERLEDISDLDPERERKRVKDIKNSIATFTNETQWAAGLRAYMADWEDISDVATSLSPWLLNTNDERYALLEEDSATKRADIMEKMIRENLEGLKVNMEAKSATKAAHEKIYRENAIKKQISYLQRELDEMNPEEVSDVRKFETLIEECGMNDIAKKEATKILKRLKEEHSGSQESALLYDYLDFVTGLPWKKEENHRISLDHAKDVLDKDHFGLKKVKKRILEQIAVMRLKGVSGGSILCFVGPPGTGKTSIGASIAKALNREYIRVSLGGVRDEADIRGHRRTYVGAMPGRIMNGINRAGSNNPVMVLDEVDKMGQSYNGDPAAALLEVLDPEQNNNFTDHYMNVPYDLSNVLFICTANSMETIPEPLLNRMEVISFEGYTPIEKLSIAKDHLIPKAKEKAGIGARELSISKDAIARIIREYTRESGVRGLKKRMDEICRQAAVNIVTREDDKKRKASQKVTKDNLKDYLEGQPLHDKSVKNKAVPGVVTGLAYTSVGGDILYMETKFVKGAGDVIITGHLGDVMTESVKVAITIVKDIFPDSGKLFKENTLHIHVPDGATPKDGPSAGITLVTAIASLVKNRAVTPKLAMTGEVNLEGEVKPIGGLTEKLMAAQRSGVKTVLIPKDNVEDLTEVPQEIQKALKIIPVSSVSEVLKLLKIKRW